MKKILILLLGLLVLSDLLSAQTLILAWESDALLAKPESAIFDRETNSIYVSNINGKYCTKDGNGFISKVNLDGNITELKWIDGLDSPQGLAIYNKTLYVADVDKIIEINIPSMTKKEYVVEEAEFLNDAAADGHGNVFFTDCKTNKIHCLAKDVTSVWLSDTLLKSPNGMLWSGTELLLANMGNGLVYRIEEKTKQMKVFCAGIKNCDGITTDGEGGFFVSGAWQGEIFHIDENGNKNIVLDLGLKKTIVADISYIPEARLLLVPTLNKTLQAYAWTKQ